MRYCVEVAQRVGVLEDNLSQSGARNRAVPVHGLLAEAGFYLPPDVRFVKDLVAALIAAMSTANTVGHAFNVANSRALTQAEVVDMMAKAAGKTVEVVRVPRERILRSGGHPMGPNLYFGQYFDLPPITTLVAKAQRVLRFKPVSFADGLAETYKWYQRHHKRTAIDYSFEDALLARASAQLAS